MRRISLRPEVERLPLLISQTATVRYRDNGALPRYVTEKNGSSFLCFLLAGLSAAPSW
jgi:hypothetical protein